MAVTAATLDWESARVLLAVVRGGSMMAAARALAMSQPTVSRMVQQLEHSCGQPLFIRHARGVRLSRVGAELLVHAERAEIAMASFERVARRKAEIDGVLRLTTSEFLGVEVLAPRLHELRELYPRLRLELLLQNVASDLTRGDADLALRLFRPSQPELVIKAVGHLELGLYASRAYLERRGSPENFDGLLCHDLIGFDPRGPMHALYERFDPRLVSERFALGTDCLSAQVALARGGFGIAGLQAGFARKYPELVRVLPELPMPRAEAWLVTHEDLRESGPVRAGFEWLERVMADYASVS